MAKCYRKAHPEKAVAIKARYKARKRGVADTLTSEQLEFERKIGQATYPGEELDLHHIVPLGKGNHSWGNIIFIPASLNRSIGNKLPREVFEQLTLDP